MAPSKISDWANGEKIILVFGYLLRLPYILQFPSAQEEDDDDNFDEVAEEDLGCDGENVEDVCKLFSFSWHDSNKKGVKRPVEINEGEASSKLKRPVIKELIKEWQGNSGKEEWEEGCSVV